MPRHASGLPDVYPFLTSLRSLSYETSTAIADIIDNSIDAGAEKVEVSFLPNWDAIQIVDNGKGMTPGQLEEAMRLASDKRIRSPQDLGKFGLGLKLASLSRGKRLEVISRAEDGEISKAVLDMDIVEQRKDWDTLIDMYDEEELTNAEKGLIPHTGTVVLISHLDNLLGEARGNAHLAMKTLISEADKARDHLGLVFSRFLLGQVPDRRKLEITVNNQIVHAWDPFCLDEAGTTSETPESLASTDVPVAMRGYVLPSESEFSSDASFKRAGGPKRWLASQGFYVYRNSRLIKWGGWLGTEKGVDEHTKMARISLDLTAAHDKEFNIDISKNSASLPGVVKPQAKMYAARLKGLANAKYRSNQTTKPVSVPETAISAKDFAKRLDLIATQSPLQLEWEKLKVLLFKLDPELGKIFGSQSK